MEREHKALIVGILLALSLLTALLLESRIGSGVAYQLTFIFIAVIISSVVVLGAMMARSWAYPLGILVFVLSLANILWLFASTGALLGFAFGILVNVIGLILCIMNIERAEEEHTRIMDEPLNLETYDASSMRAEIPLKRGRGRPRKNQVYSNF